MGIGWILIAVAALFVGERAFATTDDYSKRDDVRRFVEELVAADGFSREELLEVFSEANYKQTIVDAISRPAEKVLPWKEYQDIFLTRSRIIEGRRFMMENHVALLAARDRYGIPPVIVASIIGVETMYGRNRGRFRVIDALSTLAFDYAPRGDFFKGELREFLLLAREEKRSPLEPLGSYAGAMGYGQFIPSSYRHYAVDFDGDGVKDIWNNRADAIGSVANYLAAHGWQDGGPVIVRARLRRQSRQEGVFTESLEPSATISDLRLMGVVSDLQVEDHVKVTPIRLQGKSGPEYWLGFRNFYVITRYNRSKLYAMAVFQLSERLLKPEIVNR